MTEDIRTNPKRQYMYPTAAAVASWFPTCTCGDSFFSVKLPSLYPLQGRKEGRSPACL